MVLAWLQVQQAKMNNQMTVSHWMGHSSPAVTMKIYAKVLPEAEKWHSNTIGKALFR